MRTLISAAAILAASTTATCVHAQYAAKPAADKQPAAVPAAAKSASDPAAEALLRAAFDAMKVTKFWKYSAIVEGTQSGSATGEYKADVILERADAGGWKVLVEAEVKLSKSETAKPKKIVVAYDGASARSIRDTDKQVGELTDPADLAEVMGFFAKERAASPVVWELLADKSLDEKGLVVKSETAQEVEGVLCDVLLAEFKGEKAKDLDPIDAAGGRYYIGQKDHMLRKVERMRANSKPGDKPVKTVTMTGTEFAEQPKGANFAIQVPKGYTVKPEAKKSKPKPIQAAKEEVKAKPAAGALGAHTVGKPVTPFEAKLLDGKSVKFPGDFKGKVVMLDFWATWCGPCMGEMPNVVSVYSKYRSKGFEILGVTLDNKGAEAKIKDTAKNEKMTWSQVYDGGGWSSAVAKLYGINSIPHAYLVDGDTGLILDAGEGMRGDALAKTVETALAAKKTAKPKPVAAPAAPGVPDHTVGKPITTFEAKMLDGKGVKFPGDYKGKIVMLDFWATWCGPCMSEMPNVASVYTKYHDKGFEILSVTLDNKDAEAKIKQVAEEQKMIWSQVYDGGGWQAAVAKLYGINSIPRAFLVDGDTGLIIDAGDGMRGEELAKTVEAALAKKKK